MPENNVELVSMSRAQIREKRRKKRNRLAVLFVGAVMGMIADWYH